MEHRSVSIRQKETAQQKIPSQNEPLQSTLVKDGAVQEWCRKQDSRTDVTDGLLTMPIALSTQNRADQLTKRFLRRDRVVFNLFEKLKTGLGGSDSASNEDLQDAKKRPISTRWR
ncbi:hypothetical protein AVEN_262352-1 [Araneus ventricosus]|uniref:Uncharacterized protein n=1 Tax=Araneus ventricosus TaxID=182803 RepID=A0A4Y2Q377_ARAVE|nr:hypothetical protein AVEN_262352-1 [Araneus ventricosus]